MNVISALCYSWHICSTFAAVPSKLQETKESIVSNWVWNRVEKEAFLGSGCLLSLGSDRNASVDKILHYFFGWMLQVGREKKID